ncbi:unnamed protein product [Somion occarium]|uniref:Galactose mutarotase-like protein n=1 Tax=Somion occarium TaxID=3059160 RepID=A0ABP1EBM6_9APHY
MTEPVFLALPSLTPSLALEVLPRGLTIHRLYVQADGRTHDLVIGPEDPKDHLNQKYTNTIVGRYANRIPTDSQPYIISRNKITSAFTPQPNESPSVSLHGGKSGFDSRDFEPLLDLGAVRLFTNKEKASIAEKYDNGAAMIFRRVSEDGEEGFPGKLLLEVLVALVEPHGPQIEKLELSLGSIVIVYRAKLLDENKVTPINLTQHWGFNLDASLKDEVPDSLSVKEHKLSIKADHTISLTETGLSTGALSPVKGTHHAHGEKETGKIGEKWPEGGYDHFYLFSRPSPPSTQPTRIPASQLTPDTSFVEELFTKEPESVDPVVELASDRSGIRLSFDTNPDPAILEMGSVHVDNVEHGRLRALILSVVFPRIRYIAPPVGDHPFCHCRSRFSFDYLFAHPKGTASLGLRSHSYSHLFIALPCIILPL